MNVHIVYLIFIYLTIRLYLNVHKNEYNQFHTVYYPFNLYDISNIIMYTFINTDYDKHIEYS